jgi:hypothetical protein
MEHRPSSTPRSLIFEQLRGVVISAAVGLGIVYLVTFNNKDQFDGDVAVYGLLIGTFGYIFCAGLAWLFRRWFATTRLPAWLAHSLVYFVGGIAGWLLANRVGSWLDIVHYKISLHQYGTYIPAGVVGVLVGLVFYGFSLMQIRLEKSVARLKEAEFAEKEIQLARDMQQRILPPPEVSGDGYRITARNLPARFVAGDFYDFFNLADGAVGLVVADVSGKGIGAGLLMASAKAALPFIAADRRVDEVMREANRRIKPRLDAREFVAMAYAHYDPRTGRFELGNAGLPDPYVLGANGTPRALSVPGPRFPLGVRNEVAYEQVSGQLAPGERLFLLSDGLPEAPTPAGEPLGYERFEELLSRAGRAGPDALFDLVRSATSSSLADDWTLLILERTA